MNKFFRLLAVLTVIIMLFCGVAAGCGNDTSSDTANNGGTITTPEDPSGNTGESGGNSDTTNYAQLRADAKQKFSAVSQGFTASSPYDFIPAAMIPGYSANLVTETQITYDFSGFVNVSDIKYGGFGEQWNMVIDNIRQSETFYKNLESASKIVSAAINTVDDYLDTITEKTFEKTFEKSEFTAVISYSGNKTLFSVEYKTSIANALFGNVSPLIKMEYDDETKVKVYTVKITDTNQLRCLVTDNRYEFGMEYGVSAGSRTSYLLIERRNGKVEGHIYEYITLKGKDVMPSCADFYIDNEYVSVVGNKANAMLVAKGYINELYKKKDGKLLGYEIRETISDFDYNTLWFNLNDIGGVTSVKIGDKTDQNKSGKSTNDVYLNGSTTLFAPTYNKKLGVKTSRKYDVEFRTQYFYGVDTTGKTVEYAVELPMMFIQEDNDKDTNFSDFPNDIKNDNNVVASIRTDTAVLNRILSDYDRLIDDFIQNKQMMSSAAIKAYIET